MTLSDKYEKLKSLLEEAHEYGFRKKKGEKDGRVRAIESNYLCAESGKPCIFHYLPTEYIYGGDVKGALTDGHGGWIYYEGKWAENVSDWFIREQIQKNRTKQIDLLI